jgi:DNA-binding NtrC family response regulator
MNSMFVLIVDDSQPCRKCLKKIVKDLGFECKVAENG